VSVITEERDRSLEQAPAPQAQSAIRFPPRVMGASWPADEAAGRMTSPPFVLAQASRQAGRARGVRLLLSWLADQPGRDWQERWAASGAEAAGPSWRQVPTAWLQANGHHRVTHHLALVAAVPLAVSADVVRPSLNWLAGGGLAGGGLLVRNMAASRDSAGFARLRAACDADPGVSAVAASRVLYRGALLVAAKGGLLTDVTVGDVIELFDAEEQMRVSASDGRALLYRTLHKIGIFGPDAPPMLRALRTTGQRTPDELIDRYHLVCRPVRDLLVDYLRERQPALVQQPGLAGQLPRQAVLG